jgi:hypothetical protein
MCGFEQDIGISQKPGTFIHVLKVVTVEISSTP